MGSKRYVLYTLLTVLVLFGASAGGRRDDEGVGLDHQSMINPALARRVATIQGINLGNALEAPIEGSWGVTLYDEDFSIIAEGGFNTVRVPIRWNAHALQDPPFTVDEGFFARIDWVLDNAEKNGLLAIINMHHYDAIFSSPADHEERFLAIWRQIAERYADREDDRVWFEILNEPHDRLSGAVWYNLLKDAIAVVRESNSSRPIVVTGDRWGAAASLFGLRVPDDRNLVYTFHYYEPFEFTHQGASWVSGSHRWLGTTWEGTNAQRAAIERHFNSAELIANRAGYPVLVGEFGAYSAGSMPYRVLWTRCVVETARAHGFGYAYWEYRHGFGAYDRSRRNWNEALHDALIR
jgi:endoglucanase